jgi:tetratricopeptide (TPR) repeat protein
VHVGQWEDGGRIAQNPAGHFQAEPHFSPRGYKMDEMNKFAAIENFDLGYIETCLKNFDDAIVHFTRAIELDPVYVEAYHNRGLAYFLLGQDCEAQADFLKAAELDHKFEVTESVTVP